MARPTTVEKRLDKALELLERLVVALETRNYLDQVDKLAAPPSTSGYRCGRCGTWVLNGTMHACGTTWGSGSYVQCGAQSHLGTCALPKDHTSVHQFYRVMNVATDG